MGLIARILIGLVIAVIGFFMVLRTLDFLDFFGPIAWAEEKMGSGGSILFYKLMGVGISLLGFAVMTNLWENILIGTLGQLFPKYRN